MFAPIKSRSALKLDHRGSSNEYPQPMFWCRNKKINVYPCKPQFYSIKVGFKGVKIGMCFDTVEIWFGIANEQISSIFDGVICLRHAHIFVSGL